MHYQNSEGWKPHQNHEGYADPTAGIAVKNSDHPIGNTARCRNCRYRSECTDRYKEAAYTCNRYVSRRQKKKKKRTEGV